MGDSVYERAVDKVQQLLQSQGAAGLREKVGAGAPIDPSSLRMHAQKVDMEARSVRNGEIGKDGTIANITDAKSPDLAQADLTLQTMREIDDALAELDSAHHHEPREAGQGVLGALPGGPAIAVASIAVEDLSNLSAPSAFSDAGREARQNRDVMPIPGK